MERKQSRHRKGKSAGPPRLDTGNGEAAAILEFGFDYDFKNHIECTDASNWKTPGLDKLNRNQYEKQKKGGNSNVMAGKTEGAAVAADAETAAAEDGDQKQEENALAMLPYGTSSGFGKGPGIANTGFGKFGQGVSSSTMAMAATSAAATDTPTTSKSNALKGDGNLSGSQEEEEEDRTCPKCKKPSLIWVKNTFVLERKNRAYLIQLCRDFRCHAFTGKVKNTLLPTYMTSPWCYTPAVWTKESMKRVVEEEAEERRARKMSRPGSNGADDLDAEDEDAELARKGLKDPFKDPRLKRLIELVAQDPTAGIPQCFDKPFDLVGAQAMKGLSDSELLATLEKMFPNGIPKLAEITDSTV